MKILLANPRGFCAGVNMAIEALNEVIRRFGTDVYVYHEIVHNKHVVDQFSSQGVTFVDNLSDVPEGAILLYSAHGVSPEIRELSRARRLRTIDATCPLVTKVHIEAVRYAREGYRIVLIGHEGHDEVIGTMGEAPDHILLVETPEEVDQISLPHGEKIAYLTQTTLSVEEAARVISRLKQRFPAIESPPKDDICYATTNRQEAVAQLTPLADVVLVLGSQNSSNSRRLAELAQSQGKKAFLIDGKSEIREEWFAGCQTVLITAGASAPEVVVQECIEHLIEKFAGSVEEIRLRDENVHFLLPKELRENTDLRPLLA